MGCYFDIVSYFWILEARLRSQSFPKHQSRSYSQNALSNPYSGWGFPAGVRNSAAFEKCPKITKPDGVESIVCDGSTCMSGTGFNAVLTELRSVNSSGEVLKNYINVHYKCETNWVCERGKIALNRRRIRCKEDPEKGFFWDKKLSKCIECEPNKPIAQKDVILKCKINNQYGLRQCLVKCKNKDALLAGYPKDRSFNSLSYTVWWYSVWLYPTLVHFWGARQVGRFLLMRFILKTVYPRESFKIDQTCTLLMVVFQ